MDVSKIEVIAGGTVVYEAALPSRPTSVGKEQGSQAESAQRAIRFDADIAFTPPGNGNGRWRGVWNHDDGHTGSTTVATLQGALAADAVV